MWLIIMKNRVKIRKMFSVTGMALVQLRDEVRGMIPHSEDRPVTIS